MCRLHCCFPETTNIALGKSTWQSPGFAHSNKAVDGNINSNYGAGSCTHTANDISNPIWVVDLGHRYQVSSVKITNRGDCCGM